MENKNIENNSDFISKILMTTPKKSNLNQEESFWFIRWIFMRRKYKKALIEIENLKDLKTVELSRLQSENKRLESLLVQLRTSDMFSINKTKRKYKNKK